MTFRKLIILAGIGGLVYAHRKRGGQMTVDSFKQSGRDFLDMAKGRVDEIRSQAETKLHDAANKVADRTDQGVGTEIGGSKFGASPGSPGYGGYSR